jgi:polysaccharide biosynthesis/export protein
MTLNDSNCSRTNGKREPIDVVNKYLESRRMKMRRNKGWASAFRFTAGPLGATLMVLAGGLLVPAAEKPDATVVAPAINNDYRLGPEDVVEVFVWKEPDLSTNVVVRPDGKISLPLVGELEVTGKSANQLQVEIEARLQKYVSQPVVNVMVKQINSLKISVLGEVRKPDVYKIKNRVTVLDAIAMAGGFTDLARPTKVVVLRNTPAGQQRFLVNLKEVTERQGQPFYLEPLDTVYVEGR